MTINILDLLIMNYRYMRTLLFFDLPTITNANKRTYRIFVKNLINIGFYRIQESVFVKMSITPQAASQIVNFIEKIKPPEGNILSITITEKQFAAMHIYLGLNETDLIVNDDVVVEL